MKPAQQEEETISSDIKTASALGSGIGIAVGYALGWSPIGIFLCFMIGMLVGAIWYRPREIVTIAWSVIRETWPSEKIEYFMSITPDKWIKGLIIFCYFILMITFIFMPGILLLLFFIEIGVPIATAFCVSMALGWIPFCIGLAIIKFWGHVKRSHTSMFPIFRRLPFKLFYQVALAHPQLGTYIRFADKTIFDRIMSLTYSIFMVEIWSAVGCALLIIDTLLSIFIRCCTTERLAVVTGVCMGCAYGAGNALFSSAPPAIYIVCGMVVGAVSSNWLYRAAQYLAQPARCIEKLDYA